MLHFGEMPVSTYCDPKLEEACETSVPEIWSKEPLEKNVCATEELFIGMNESHVI